MIQVREPIYEALADAVVMPGPPGVIERAMPAIQALRSLPTKTRLLWAASASGEYPAFVGEGLLECDWWPLEGRRFCLTDRDVASIYAGRIEPTVARIEVDPGEGAKTMASAEQVLEQLSEAGMTRADHLVALGGGVVGDLGGFCAHTYQRGVPVVQVPTTVVAQVDSAYGGKTGVDLPQAKNYVGAYHLPAAVIADWATISTLPPAELAAGFVEVLKTALLAGGELWEGVRAIPEGELGDHPSVAFACARYKCEVVAADERDAGLAPGAQSRPHGRPRDRGRERLPAATATARRSGSGCLRPCGSPAADELRGEVAAWLARHGLPTGLDPGVGIERGAGGDRARQEAGLRRGPLRPPRAAGTAADGPGARAG